PPSRSTQALTCLHFASGALAASGARPPCFSRFVCRFRGRYGRSRAGPARDQPLGAGLWRQALTGTVQRTWVDRPVDIVWCYICYSRELRPPRYSISPPVVLYLMLRSGTGDDRMVSADLLGLRMFGLHRWEVEIASSHPA